jgi:ssDNA-binding Zn-finger/Zn-ribbon topoisomerase 1
VKYKYIGKIKCDACGQEYVENAVEIQKTKIELNGIIVDFVYFTCPKCDKIYRVSIQDARYYDLVEDLEKAKKRVRRNRGNNDKETARVLDRMVRLKHQRLKEYVDAVNKAFSGTFTFVTSENNPREKVIKYLP